MHKILVRFGCVVSEICKLTDKAIRIVSTPLGDKVTKGKHNLKGSSEPGEGSPVLE